MSKEATGVTGGEIFMMAGVMSGQAFFCLLLVDWH